MKLGGVKASERRSNLNREEKGLSLRLCSIGKMKVRFGETVTRVGGCGATVVTICASEKVRMIAA